MTITPTFNVINSAGVAQAIVDGWRLLASQAIAEWSKFLAGDANPTIKLEILDTTPSGRAQGGPAATIGVGAPEGGVAFEGTAAWELRTGSDPNSGGADIIIQVAKDYLLNQLFLDPTPETDSDIPAGKVDGFSVLLHELGHALGFTGFYDEATDTFLFGARSPYDLRLNFTNGDVFFEGPNVHRVLGGAAPLTRNNYTHYGNSNAHPSGGDLLTGLMNGVVFFTGFRYAISELDLAFLSDMGLGTVLDDTFDQIWLNALRGGAGLDLFDGDYSTSTSPVVFDASGVIWTGPGITLSEIERLRLSLGSGDDSVTGSMAADSLSGAGGGDALFGLDGGDQLIGGAGADTLDGGAGNDTLDGGDDNDLILAQSGRDSVLGGAGDDSVDAAAGDDSVDGGANNDRIFGGTGFDLLSGNNGNDTLAGGDDNDTLTGGKGFDFLLGQNGNDSLVGEDLADTLLGGNGSDFLNGGIDNDRLLGEAQHDTILGDAGDDIIDAGTGNDTVDGGGQRDSVFGGSGFDLIDGGSGNDTLTGGTDGDTLLGGAGFDALQGDAGDDVLNGGLSNDVIFGNAGNDTIIFDLDGGTDTLRDFTAGAASEDVISLTGFGAAFDSFAEVIGAATQTGAHVTIDFGNGDMLVIRNTLVAALHADDFAFG